MRMLFVYRQITCRIITPTYPSNTTYSTIIFPHQWVTDFDVRVNEGELYNCNYGRVEMHSPSVDYVALKSDVIGIIDDLLSQITLDGSPLP